MSIIDNIRAINRKRLEARKKTRLNNPVSSFLGNGRPRKYIKLPDCPLVSIIVVNYNGISHIEGFANSINSISYKNYEVLFVDNNSSDGSDVLAESLINNCRVIRLDGNTGFAEGNNIGLDYALGELLFLLNNDVRFDGRLLESLVEEMKGNLDCCAVSPKILYYEEFHHINIRSKCKLTIDFDRILNGMSGYKKLIRKIHSESVECVYEFAVPVSVELKNIPIFWEDQLDSDVLVTVQGIRMPVDVGVNALTFLNDMPSGSWTINNAGTFVYPDGRCGDIGINEIDIGQYDKPREIDAFCGCAVLIRRESLDDLPLFSPDFFAYYEDTELSIRLRRSGGVIRYQPKSVLYHKHASTSLEGSANFKYLTSRNRLAFLAVHFPKFVDRELNSARSWWAHLDSEQKRSFDFDKETLGFISRIPELREDVVDLIDRSKRTLIYSRRRAKSTVGIFNSYWGTLGGGELRALHLAEVLSADNIVDLISDRYFSIDDLRSRFGLKLDNVRPIFIQNFSSQNTSKYGLFINTTYRSNLVSHAKKSLYLVSFPHADVLPAMLDSYDVFLANSKFTEKYMKKYWSPYAPIDVLYPAVDVDINVPDFSSRENLILSIGRFFQNGHNKKQLEMVNAFKSLCDLLGRRDWRLVLVGACDLSDADSVNYLNLVKNSASGYPIDVCVNIDNEDVSSYKSLSKIYWHATGLGSSIHEPEKLEHFGMALCEAMASGCIPIAYNGGGPSEILLGDLSEFLFSNEDDLVSKTVSLISRLESDELAGEFLGAVARRRSLDFSMTSHNENFKSILKKLV